MLSRTAVLVAGALVLLPLAGAGAGAAQERGFPLIQPYFPSLPEAETQNFGIARDPQGTLYIANLGGILIHDGAWWRLVEIGAARTAFSVAADAAGRVAVGGVDEIGYLKADEGGALRYVSLTGLLAPGQRKLGQVLRVLPTPEGFAFLTSRWLLLWDGETVRTVATFPGDRPYTAIFPVGETVYVWTREGLSRLAGTQIQPVPGGELFRGRRIDQLLPADRDALLISVRGEGLFLFRGGLAEPFAPEASRWAVENKLLEGERLDDGRWVLGSVLGGALLLLPDGAVDQVIDTASGLADDFVNGIAVDPEGSLWLALNNGLARVDVASPLSVLDARSGLKGSVYHVARHRGELWAATSAGVFRSGGQSGALRMRAVPGLPASGWSLLSRGDDLLAGTAYGLYVIQGGGAPRLLPGVGQRTVYLLAPSPADPARVWVGTEDGLEAIRKEGSVWRHEGTIEGAPREVRTLVESGGVLWCGTEFDGLVRVELPRGWPSSGRLGRLGPPRMRPVPDSFGARPFAVSGGILVALEDRLLRLDEARGRLLEEPALAGLTGRFYTLAEDAGGNLWRNTRPVSVVRRREGRQATLVEVPARGIETIVAEPDGVVWLGGDGGLFRYEGSFRRMGIPLPAPRLARVTVAGKEISFAGAPVLGPDTRRLRIEVAPLSFRAGLRYQTRLDPLDPGWGAPAAEPFAELTRLPPGGYTFRARTVGPSGETGPETSWPFRVLPPWYRTAWALVLGLVLALAAVRGYAWLRSRTLSRRAAALEARVADQTRELRRTVAELQRAHDELEVANERLEELSLKDALTGVANRRRLQLVLDDEWGRSRRSRSPLAFALLDLDHFKLLNDTRGHGEGDRCLQMVARYLSGSLGRHSDLVARYGGEELAILLPDTDLDGALLVAEQLREGIEGLSIRVTASVGVASMIPAPGQRMEDLVEAADRALYRAKADGRNRVCAAAGGPRQVGSSKVARTGA
ncbi:MAG: diguanylate cyclase [Thermoanaerobaculia bacterium]